MHKIPFGARFIIAGKKYINKQLIKHISSAIKLCYSQIYAIFLDSTKLKIVWIKVTTFFKRRVSIIL